MDDFALRKRPRYATVIIEAQMRERIDVLPDRRTETLQACLAEHPGVEVVCRDGSAAYAGAGRSYPRVRFELVQITEILILVVR